SSHRPNSFALRSRPARTSGRIEGPSIACISIGISSRSTKVRTVFLRSLSSSGSSKSMAVFLSCLAGPNIEQVVSPETSGCCGRFSAPGGNVSSSFLRVGSSTSAETAELEHHPCRHLLGRAPRGRLAVDAVEDFLDGAEVALERLGGEPARDESQDVVFV